MRRRFDSSGVNNLRNIQIPMGTQYSDYGYRTEANPSGADGERLGEKIISHISSMEDVRSICDLGCGNGWLANRMASLGYDVVGVDGSPTGIEVAGHSKKGGAEFLCRPVNKELVTHVPAQSFDAVVSSEVIEHLYRPADLLEAAHALLRSGGHLVLTTPYHGYLKWLLLSLSGRMDRHVNPLWDGGHIKFFDARQLSAILRQNGFTDIRFHYFGRMTGLWKSMICIAGKR